MAWSAANSAVSSLNDLIYGGQKPHYLFMVCITIINVVIRSQLAKQKEAGPWVDRICFAGLREGADRYSLSGTAKIRPWVKRMRLMGGHGWSPRGLR
jgi:hypothetical protein